MLAGAETLQLYIAPHHLSSIGRPVKELKGFKKVFLLPGETKEVEIEFDRFTCAFWDEEKRAWSCESGQYKVLVGTSSQRIHLEGTLSVETSSSWTGL